ncbi:MAG: hypothetical protein ACRD0A_01735 [Acidimicrobiales bacterium]
MPDYTQTYLDTITKSQEVTLTAATAWADHVQATWDSAVAQAKAEPQVPNPVDLVGVAFDSIEKLLGLQRDYFTGLAQAYAPLVDQLAAEAKNAAETLTAKA